MMFHKTIILSIFALLLAVASGRPQIELNECSGRENGLHANAIDSNAFFVCSDDQLVVHSKCDPGELFDAELKTCTGGSGDQDLTAYSSEGEVDEYANQLESDVSDLLDEDLKSELEEKFFNFRTTHKPPASTPKPPTRPPPPPPPHFPFPPPPGHPPHRPFPFKNKIINVRVTENIFPKSILVIGRANTEQKNK